MIKLRVKRRRREDRGVRERGREAKRERRGEREKLQQREIDCGEKVSWERFVER